MHHPEVARPSTADVEKYFRLLEACTPPKSSGSLLGSSYSRAAHQKLSKKVDKYARTNLVEQTAE
jgi:hypothetical protein